MGDPRARLGEIRAVTYAVPDLAAVEAAYAGELGYVVVERVMVPPDQALSWSAPAVAGRRMLVLQPASSEPVRLCFVESLSAAGWRAFATFGWNATEFVVQDVDALESQLEGGAFTIIGRPKGLTRFPMIRAMQAIGPAGECCYFTQVGEGSGLTLAPALSFVGRVFIAVGAGPDAAALFAPYAAFSNATDPPVSTPVRVISDAHGLPPETVHPHGLVRLSGGTLIELDGYPVTAVERPCVEGELPPGMAVVSFDVETLEGHALVGPPHKRSDGALTACIRGAVGELIELVTPREAGGRA